MEKNRKNFDPMLACWHAAKAERYADWEKKHQEKRHAFDRFNLDGYGRSCTGWVRAEFLELLFKGPSESTKEPCQRFASCGPSRRQWARILDSPTPKVATHQSVRILKVRVRVRGARPLQSYR